MLLREKLGIEQCGMIPVIELLSTLAGALFVASWLHAVAYGPITGMVSWILGALTFSIMCLCAVSFVKSQSSTDASRWLAFCLMSSALASAMFALIQWLRLESNFAGWIVQTESPGIVANLRQRNQLATLLAMGWLVGLLSSCHRLDTHVKAALCGLILIVLAMTSSRTGALQLLAAAAFCAYIAPRFRSWAILSIVTYAIASALLPLLARILSIPETGLTSRFGDENAYSRIALWMNILELISQSPWTGHGWRSLAYMHYATDFSGTRFMEMPDNAHNLPFHLAVELGVPSALAFCALVVWAVWRGRPWAEVRWDRQMAWGILLVIGIHSMVEYPLWYGPFFITTLGAIAILSADSWKKWYLSLSNAAQHATFFAAKMLMLVLLAVTSFVAWDYHRVSQIYLPPEQRSRLYSADTLAVAKRSVLFQSHAKFAELQITALTPASAPRILELSLELVRWSPEPRIIEKLIESAVMLGRDDLAQFHLRRYLVAYPSAAKAWMGRGNALSHQVFAGHLVWRSKLL